MPSVFDADWHNRALKGEQQAIKTLAESTLTPLYRFCLYRMGGNRHLCEEVVQETMLRAIRELDRYEPARSHNSIFGWLTGLARNEIRRSLAREQPLHQFQLFWNKVDIELASVFADLETETINDEVLERHETSQMVNATMAQLPPHYQEALQAKYVHGLSVREVALLLHASEKAAESVLSRARTAFRSTFLALARNWNVEFSPDG